LAPVRHDAVWDRGFDPGYAPNVEVILDDSLGPSLVAIFQLDRDCITDSANAQLGPLERHGLLYRAATDVDLRKCSPEIIGVPHGSWTAGMRCKL
jgi:hypothetical protein